MNILKIWNYEQKLELYVYLNYLRTKLPIEELEEAMLDWWADIKIPANDEEKKEMISQIDKILEEARMLQDLHVIEDVRYTIFQRSN